MLNANDTLILIYNTILCQIDRKACLNLAACDDGTYGTDCAWRCGWCKDYMACDKVTGQCPAGCQTGWTGSMCTQSRLLRYKTCFFKMFDFQSTSTMNLFRK